MSRSRAYRLLALVPALALLVGVPLVNGVHRYVLGLPFLLFWIVACVLLASVVMALIGVLDRRRDAASERLGTAPRANEGRRP
ncbi:MAG: hypothetical protein DMD82_06605 [Candidatus Rokuibacteriota bacterium]|nr:MAG: hypothetical protein DMD82_06605 [Candidatus Rokubacteria bacterium]